MATNSFPEPEELRRWVETTGLNPSLPFLIFDHEQRTLLGANPRMRQILGLQASEGALGAERFKECWPFFNEDVSALALLKKVFSVSKGSHVFMAEAGLKTFRLFVRKVPGSSYTAVVAEMLRHGDLLQDSASRQVLFRSISHEIRSAVTAVKGFLGMMESAEHAEVLRRMQTPLRRLEHVVTRLADFRAEMETEGKARVKSDRKTTRKRSPARKR